MMRILVCCFAGFLLWSCNSVNPEIRKDKEIILVRKVGHEIMKYIGDSTTSISPIKELNPGNYQVDFKMPFSFISDTIINIIDREFKQVSSEEYIVKVNSCTLNELIFSYLISPQENSDLISCLGRNQKEDCYNIQITFLHDEGISIWIVTASVIGILSIILLWFLFQKKRPHIDSVENEEEVNQPSETLKTIGEFEFSFEEQYLSIDKKRDSLTYKEAKILKILNVHFNEVVTREKLLKEVWEDEGLMVSRSLDMFISKLRKKLKADSNVQIINIHGIGYKLIAG